MYVARNQENFELILFLLYWIFNLKSKTYFLFIVQRHIEQANLLYSPVLVLLTLPTCVRCLCSFKCYSHFNVIDNTLDKYIFTLNTILINMYLLAMASNTHWNWIYFPCATFQKKLCPFLWQNIHNINFII